MCTVLDWEVIRREVLTAKLSRRSNDDYEVLKLENFQGSFTSNSKTFKVLLSFQGPGRMDTFFQGPVAPCIQALQPDHPPLHETSHYCPCLVSLHAAVDNHHHYYSYTGLTASFPGQPGQAGTRKIKPVWN